VKTILSAHGEFQSDNKTIGNATIPTYEKF
jgi:hypothetical protein